MAFTVHCVLPSPAATTYPAFRRKAHSDNLKSSGKSLGRAHHLLDRRRKKSNSLRLSRCSDRSAPTRLDSALRPAESSYHPHGKRHQDATATDRSSHVIISRSAHNIKSFCQRRRPRDHTSNTGRDQEGEFDGRPPSAFVLPSSDHPLTIRGDTRTRVEPRRRRGQTRSTGPGSQLNAAERRTDNASAGAGGYRPARSPIAVHRGPIGFGDEMPGAGRSHRPYRKSSTAFWGRRPARLSQRTRGTARTISASQVAWDLFRSKSGRFSLTVPTPTSPGRSRVRGEADETRVRYRRPSRDDTPESSRPETGLSVRRPTEGHHHLSLSECKFSPKAGRKSPKDRDGKFEVVRLLAPADASLVSPAITSKLFLYAEIHGASSSSISIAH